jgi:hypothetical protein
MFAATWAGAGNATGGGIELNRHGFSGGKFARQRLLSRVELTAVLLLGLDRVA